MSGSATETQGGGGRLLRVGVECFLVVVLALLAARLVWLVVSPAGSVSTSVPSAGGLATPVSSTPQTVADRSVLTRLNPFVPGEITEVIVAEPIVEDAPETDLNLRLGGARADPENPDDPVRSAFITTPDGAIKVVSVGDEIIDDVTLERVYPNRVIIRSRGQLETLYRRDEDSRAFLGAPTREVAAGQRRSEASPRRGEPVSGAALYRGTQLAPLISDGVMQGFSMTPRGSGEIFARAGFQANDVLRAIDGRSVSSFEFEDFEEYFTGRERIEVTIEREGATLSIPVTFVEEG